MCNPFHTFRFVLTVLSIHNQQLFLFFPAGHQWLTHETELHNNTTWMTQDLYFFLRPMTFLCRCLARARVTWPLKFVMPSVGLRTINCLRPWRLCLCLKWVVSYAERTSMWCRNGYSYNVTCNKIIIITRLMKRIHSFSNVFITLGVIRKASNR